MSDNATPHHAASVYYVEVKGGRTVGGYNEPFECAAPGVFLSLVKYAASRSL